MMKKVIAGLFFFGCMNVQCAEINSLSEKFQYVPELPSSQAGKHQVEQHPLDVKKNNANLKWKLDHDVEFYHFREENALGELKSEGGGIRW
ncbi:hypothetical protein SAMN05216516_101559 [Izhakiella capsodis]|uniref:Uncharacterized protein n=1 Tax=Izhakiella capsodis TaxID=1367852 RepID=A0A1I4V5G3_9GAMM|nr:hypothetical protein [Izhakiella capsodis]SFM96401.1 hypothetical protein SAMN05216516_101559 [Izhakiella capsodis]